MFKGCEGLSQEETKKCFSQKISQHVGKEFNTKIGKENGLVGKQRIYTRFKIDSTGKIVDIQVRGPLPEIEKETHRVIKTLPAMTPGVQDGVNVSVLFSLPIVYEIK